MTTALLFGLAPAFRIARAKPSLVLKEESGTIGAGLGLRRVLVTAQIALALVLLIGAGLFVRTLESLRAKGPGFATTNQVMLRVDAARSGYSRARASQLIRSLLTTSARCPRCRPHRCQPPSCLEAEAGINSSRSMPGGAS